MKTKIILLPISLALICSFIIGTVSLIPAYIVDTAPVIHKDKPLKASESLYKGTIREVTMYNSVAWQTDDSPCIGATGENLCNMDFNVCASNAFPLNTCLVVDKLGECIVKDRMARRYQNSVDWYAKFDVDRAINFGRQRLLVVECSKS